MIWYYIFFIIFLSIDIFFLIRNFKSNVKISGIVWFLTIGEIFTFLSNVFNNSFDVDTILLGTIASAIGSSFLFIISAIILNEDYKKRKN